MEKTLPPRDVIFEAVGLSIQSLHDVVRGVNDVSNPKRHQLLIPDSEEGLSYALVAYKYFLTDTPLSGINDNNRRLLASYNNEWSFLFDALREANKDVGECIDKARELQKEVHKKLIEVLSEGHGEAEAEFTAFTDGLRQLSEEWGGSLERSRKRSRKGLRHVRTFTSAEQGAEWAKVGVATSRRYWKSPKFGLPRPPLDDKTNPEAALKKWGELFRSNRAKKKEVNNMRHPVSESLLSVGQRRRAKLE